MPTCPELSAGVSYTTDENSNGSGDAQMAYPAGIVAGDVLVLMVTSGKATGGVAIPPVVAGFTSVFSYSNGQNGYRFSYKVAVGGEAGNVTTMPAQGIIRWARAVMVRIADPTGPPEAIAGSALLPATSHVIASSAVSGPGLYLVLVGGDEGGISSGRFLSAQMCDYLYVDGNNYTPGIAGELECILAAGETGTRTFTRVGSDTSDFYAKVFVPGAYPCGIDEGWVVGAVTL